MAIRYVDSDMICSNSEREKRKRWQKYFSLPLSLSLIFAKWNFSHQCGKICSWIVYLFPTIAVNIYWLSRKIFNSWYQPIRFINSSCDLFPCHMRSNCIWHSQYRQLTTYYRIRFFYSRQIQLVIFNKLVCCSLFRFLICVSWLDGLISVCLSHRYGIQMKKGICVEHNPYKSVQQLNVWAFAHGMSWKVRTTRISNEGGKTAI